MKKFFLLLTTLALLASPARADDYNLRGLDPAGNWKSLAVDASGQVKVTGAGDVTSVGDCTTGACFDGTQGTVLTYYNAGGNATATYNGTNITFSKPLVNTNSVLTTPNLGTPSAVNLANGTALPVAGITASTSTALGVGSVELGDASDTTLSRNAAGVLQVESVIVPTVSSVNTFTNKFDTPQLQSVADAGGTLTPVSITNDMVVATALSQATTIAAPTGSPVQGENLIIRLKDNGSARALTWNGIYRASSDLALPTTTTLSKTLYCGFKYNSTDTKWDLIAKLDNF